MNSVRCRNLAILKQHTESEIYIKILWVFGDFLSICSHCIGFDYEEMLACRSLKVENTYTGVLYLLTSSKKIIIIMILKHVMEVLFVSDYQFH